MKWLLGIKLVGSRDGAAFRRILTCACSDNMRQQMSYMRAVVNSKTNWDDRNLRTRARPLAIMPVNIGLTCLDARNHSDKVARGRAA